SEFLIPGRFNGQYQVDINNPEVRKLEAKYRKARGLHVYFPLSNNERFEFEAYIMPRLRMADSEEDINKIDFSDFAPTQKSCNSL
ncbi:MAG: hypothetical protein RSE39_03475, partial [Oscillospiraceae bacterium]